jgi:hypothetical protein
MLKYYGWAVAEKTLSVVPFGDRVYHAASLVANAGTRSERRLAGCMSAYELVRKAYEMTPRGGTVLDVGTGWHHHDVILLFLLGDYRFHLFDVEDKARLPYLRTYFRYLLRIVDELEREIGVDRKIATEKLSFLLSLPSREAIYRACNFTLHITTDTDRPFLPEGSVDFMVSICVLSHIPPHIVEPELVALRRMLRPGGAMYVMVGHDDHWAFHDPRANRFNYYRYSEEFYRLLFHTRFEYQNRLVRSEWEPIFRRAGLRVSHYLGDWNEASIREVRALPHIDPHFRQFPIEELATAHSFFLLTHADAVPDQPPPREAREMAELPAA